MVWNWVWFLEEATFLLLSSIEKCVFSTKNRKSEALQMSTEVVAVLGQVLNRVPNFGSGVI